MKTLLNYNLLCLDISYLDYFLDNLSFYSINQIALDLTDLLTFFIFTVSVLSIPIVLYSLPANEIIKRITGGIATGAGIAIGKKAVDKIIDGNVGNNPGTGGASSNTTSGNADSSGGDQTGGSTDSGGSDGSGSSSS